MALKRTVSCTIGMLKNNLNVLHIDFSVCVNEVRVSATSPDKLFVIVNYFFFCRFFMK